MKELMLKKDALFNILNGLDSLMVAYSGGLDSSFLLCCAHQVLGDNVIAVTAISPSYPERERKSAIAFTKKMGVRHEIIESDELSIPEYSQNSPLRCYYCKKELLSKLKELAERLHVDHIAHGANMDDIKDFRPGMKAAQEQGILAPLMEANLYKKDIMKLSKEMGLDIWDKPSSACLASRIPYGEPITTEKLKRVEKAEDFLIKNGFRQCRVRHHGRIARIELEEEHIPLLAKDKKLKDKIVDYLRGLGFRYIALDLIGYQTGSMNKELDMEDI